MELLAMMKAKLKKEWLYLSLFFLSLLWALFSLLSSPGSFRVHPEKVLRLYHEPEHEMSETASEGFLSLTDSGIQLCFSIEPNRIESVTVIFDSVLQDDIDVHLFYAAEGESLSEQRSMHLVAPEGNKECLFNLPAGEYTQLRLDIDASVQPKEVYANGSYADVHAKFIRVVLLAALLITAAAFLLLGDRIERLYPICALTLGLLFLLSITPLSPPDEAFHYHTSYELSNILLFHWDDTQSGDSADFDYTDFRVHVNRSPAYGRIAKTLLSPGEDGETVTIPPSRYLTFFPMYLPQALGIALARLCNANLVWTFWLGRLFNLLFYVLCTYWSIRIAPKFKTLLFLVALSPMALHQAASLSYDAFLNAVAFLAVSFLLKGILGQGIVDRRSQACILITGALLAPIKVVYYPISALALLIPKSRFRNQKNRILFLCAALVLPLLLILIVRIQPLREAVADTGIGLNQEGGYNYTLSYIFEHPAAAVGIFFHTLRVYLKGWVACSVGYRLSGLSLWLPYLLPLLYIALMVLSTIQSKQDSAPLRTGVRCAFAAVAAAVGCLIMLCMFLTYTSDAFDTIQGIQGRYFIPIQPLILMALNDRHIVIKRRPDKLLVLAGYLVNIAAVNQVIIYTLRH